MFDRVLNTSLKSEVFPLCLSGNFLKKALSIFLETFSCTYVKVYLNIMQSHIKVTIYSLNPFPAGNFNKFRYSKKTNIEITKSKIFTRFNFITKLCSQEWTWLCNKLKHGKILDFVISGCILYTKISKMVIFGLFFLLFTHLLIFSYNFQLLLTFTSQFYQKC